MASKFKSEAERLEFKRTYHRNYHRQHADRLNARSRELDAARRRAAGIPPRNWVVDQKAYQAQKHARRTPEQKRALLLNRDNLRQAAKPWTMPKLNLPLPRMVFDFEWLNHPSRVLK